MGYNLKYTGEQIDELLDKINDLGYASEDTPGMMSAGDKEKLDNIEENAEENVIENVTINGVAGSRTGKTLDFVTDTTPTQGSIKMVTSGGVHAAILSEAQARQQADNTLNGLISGIRSDLANYYLKTETYNKTEVDTLIAAIKQFVPTLVQTLPEPSAQTMFILYLVPSSDPTAGDVKDEYITVMENSQYKWEKIGKTDIDLSAYSTTEQMNAAIAAAVANYTTTDDLLVMLAAKSDKDGYTPGQRVGSADDVVLGEREWSEEEILFRRSGCPYERGNAVVRGAKGRSMAWNQLAQNGDFSQGTTGWVPVALSLSASNNIVTCTSTQSVGQGNTLIYNAGVQIVGHKYLYKCEYYIPSTNTTLNRLIIGIRGHLIGFSQIDKWSTASGIEASTTANNLFAAGNGSSTAVGDKFSIRGVFVIDLTLLYGAGKEPTSVAEFERTFPNLYYPYDAGKLIHNAANRIESVGRNVWDEQWEVGRYDNTTGEKSAANDRIRNANFIPVMPSTSYYKPATVSNVYFYDADKNYLGYGYPNDQVFTTPEMCRFMCFMTFNTYGATYKNDIAISISSARNGLYTPYEKSLAHIRFDAFKVKDANGNVLTVNGLKSAGTVFDEIDIVRRKYTMRCGSYKFTGNETWVAASPSGWVCKNILQDVGASGSPFTASSSYVESIVNGSSYPKGVKASAEAGNTAAAVASAMAGVEVNYTLATPVGYDLVDDINGYYKATSLGTEASAPLTDATGDPISLPFTGELGYGQTIGEQMDDKTGQNDYAPALVAGSADGLLGVSKAQEFTFAAVPEGTGNGAARIGKVKGNSLAWNQLAVNGNFANVSWWNGNYTVSNNVATAVGILVTPKIIIGGHKYYIHLFANPSESSENGIRLAFRTSGGSGLANHYYATPANTLTRVADIITAESSAASLSIGYYGYSFNFQLSDVVVIDLTLMFGAGKEPSTVADFEKLYPEPYYPYNAGAIINNVADTLVSDGFNQWDEEWENGRIYISTGANDNNTNGLRSKNYIAVIPSQNYYINKGGVGANAYAMFYDVNKSYISYENASSAAFAVPTNAAYLRFYIPTSSAVTSYNGGVNVNRDDPARNGKYEPHWRRTLPLALTSLRGRLNGTGERVAIFPDGMKRAGDAYDEVYGNIAIKRVGSVDMGTLTYAVATEQGITYSNDIPGIKYAQLSGNYRSSKYTTKTVAGVVDKTISSTSGALYVIDSALAGKTGAEVQAAMNGVMLIYELATPEIYILDEPIPSGFAVGAGGTMHALPDAIDGTPTAPFAADIAFPRDNYGITSKNSTVALLEALKTAGKIASYTIGYDANGDMTFNIT